MIIIEAIRVGIPRALLYYKYGALWENFFKELGLQVILSPKTNKEIIEKGSQYVVDEACLSLKIFMGHVNYLADKCDYIFIPRIECLKKDEKMCTNFMALYDLVKNSFPDIKVLNYNIDVEKGISEQDAFINLGKSLNISYFKSLQAYKSAKNKEKIKNKENKQVLLHKFLNKNLKIMLIGHSYNLKDEFIGVPIIKYLENENIDVITPNVFDEDINCKNISSTIYWTYNKELMSFIDSYKDNVDGIILISTFPCGPDSLCNELIIRKIKNFPISYITVDNNSGDTGLITRLESFIDIIKIRKERECE